MALCLVVEDEAPNREILARILRRRGFEVETAGEGSAALAACDRSRPEVVILDLGLPDIDGLDLIPQLLKISPLSRIIVQTGRESVQSAVAALRAGARHYLGKPWDPEEFILVVQREAEAVSFDQLREREPGGGGMFWGENPAMVNLRDLVRKLARSPLTPVFVQGETGSGKGMLARELHRLTTPSGPFVTLNCAAIPSELLESELFGHEKGAFTGADFRRRGLAELAQGGTLFLDEIADMPLGLQAKLLRFLEDRTVRRVGGEVEIAVKCRILGATLRDIESYVADGKFREDLFYRLAVVRLYIPPLRERRQDLLPLAHRLLQETAASTCHPLKSLTPAAEDALLKHNWPGNVRELRNRLERAIVLGESPRIETADLDLFTGQAAATPHDPSEESEDPQVISLALSQSRWNVAKAARRLGVERHWLRYRMEKFDLKRPVKG